MSFGEKLSIAINVLKDWRAIFILILVLLYVGLACYIVKYKKKPAVKAPPKKAAAPAAPKKEEDSKDAAAAEEDSKAE